jgi:hypothetical protein
MGKGSAKRPPQLFLPLVDEILMLGFHQLQSLVLPTLQSRKYGVRLTPLNH